MTRSQLLGEYERRFDPMMQRIMESNPFYRSHYRAWGYGPSKPPTFAELSKLPFTLKSELARDQAAAPPFGTNLTYPLSHYTRLHQTSGTTGAALCWLDTPESWRWFLDCWKAVYRSAAVTAEDRIFCAFSFGPFAGFWGGFEAAQELGAMVLTGGALNTEQRVEQLLTLGATVVLATPTYALRLAAVARDLGLDLASSEVRLTIHAGEPGANVASVKRRLEEAWGAQAVDHAGATEVGAWGFACGVGEQLCINEAEFIAEVVDPETGEPAPVREDGWQYGELVLTNLGRLCSPVVRYRTGDLVELRRGACSCDYPYAHLRGGVLARVDDMLIVRGVNVYPAAIENVVREFEEIEEFEVRGSRRFEMRELELLVELSAGQPSKDVITRLQKALRNRLNLRVDVTVAPTASLPRYELKARRFKLQS